MLEMDFLPLEGDIENSPPGPKGKQISTFSHLLEILHPH
jgi:hypothetical protein